MTIKRLLFGSLLLPALPCVALADEGTKPDAKVSYYTQVRPIFQAQCQGCHQPAKAGGDYVMTSFDRLFSGGESEEAAVVPKKPGQSYLIAQVTPHGGKAAMPKGKPPLTPAELETVQKWIAQGAIDDTPANARIRFDKDHPPVYRRPPVLGAIDFSPDGKWLAVGGFHEVLLWKADGSELVARLVGLSERIESVRFSPDGTRLAVTGGLPARMGEVQVWDVAKKSLVLSAPITFDTVYGASWSPDGSKIALGCADNSVRAIDAKTGAQVLFMGAHNDWVLDTAFSADGSHLMSVGRDMATKLTEVATQRFVDNITSITPGALKGGLTSVARHPKRDEILIGASDGVPRLYRMIRQTVRVIGDDSNLIREFEPMKGRINTVAVSGDGKRLAAGSSLDGAGEVDVYSYEFDTSLPDPIKAIMSKVSTSRSPQEVAALQKYLKDGVKRISKVDLPHTPVYAVAFAADGKSLAAAGADGLIRLINSETGAAIKEFAPAPLSQQESPGDRVAAAVAQKSEEPVETETLPKGAKIVGLKAQPASITLKDRFAYAQILVSAQLDSGDLIDVTRMVEAKAVGSNVEVTRSGQVRPVADGKTTLTITLGALKAEVSGVTVAGMVVQDASRRFRARDVHPVMSRLAAGNPGTCHGAAQGKNGFKLSAPGSYDPIFDVRALTDDEASRRVNVASPDGKQRPDAAQASTAARAARRRAGCIRASPSTRPSAALDRRLGPCSRPTRAASPARCFKIELSPANLNHPADRPAPEAADPRAGHLHRRRGARRHARGVRRHRQHGSRLRQPLGPDDLAPPRRGRRSLYGFEGAYAATTLTVMGDSVRLRSKQPPTSGRIVNWSPTSGGG